jgi:hypothetical protein
MALKEHSYLRDSGAMEHGVVNLYAEIVIGAAGAVTAGKGGAIASVTKQATAGQYNVVLDAGFTRLLHFSAQALGATATGVCSVDILQAGSAVHTALQTGGALVIQCYDYAGAAVNPASGSVIKLKLEVRRSSVKTFD